MSRRDAEVRGGREVRLARAESAPELEVARSARRLGNVGIGRLRPTEADPVPESVPSVGVG